MGDELIDLLCILWVVVRFLIYLRRNFERAASFKSKNGAGKRRKRGRGTQEGRVGSVTQGHSQQDS